MSTFPHPPPNDDLLLIQAGVVHCPSSNFNLCSGVANVRRYLTEGIKVSVSVWIRESQ